MKRMGLTMGLLVAAALAARVQAAPAVTIYNQNFAVVRDDVRLDLKEGVNEVSVTDITAHVESNSVMLRDPAGKRDLRILEQNYRADPISEGLLLSLYEGKEISFQTGHTETHEVRGKIIRSGYVPHRSAMERYGQDYTMSQHTSSYDGRGDSIIEVDGQLQFGLPGKPKFPALTDQAIRKPTLHWLLETGQAGPLDAEITYVTGGMGWEADYNMVAPETGDTLDVVGWVTMDNQCGKTFQDAQVKLMAGDVGKIQRDNQGRYVVRNVGMMETDGRPRPPPVSEKSFDEYHLYTLKRPVTLRDRETKQVEFVRATGVTSDRIYVYDGAMIDWGEFSRHSQDSIRHDRDYGTKINPKVWVMREFLNTEANHLGLPLPAGRVRFYRRDADGRMEFTGENLVGHTPRNETLRVFTGDAFDLRGSRKRMDYKIDSSGEWCDESFEIRLRNHKEKEKVEVRVIEHLYRWMNWEVVEKSHTFLKTDSQAIEFRLRLDPGEEEVLTYKVHYSW